MKLIWLLLNCFFCFTSNAKIFVVGKTQTYTSIQLAIKAAQNGDTIIVNGGNYKSGNIILNKSITLLGKNNPVLDGEFKYEIISVRANNCHIKGFVIINSGISSIVDYAGIKLYDCERVTVENNDIKNAFFGIYVQIGKNCIIKNNRLSANKYTEHDNGNGIHCWKSDSLQIVGNKIKGHRDGIYFEFVTNSIIWRNTSTDNMRYGLHFMFSNNDTYVANVFEKNGAGVAVMFSNHVQMYNNYFCKNWGDASYGILLKEISDSAIEGNFFEQNTSGIYIEGASRVKMERNSFINNGWALKIQASCMDIKVKANNFKQNTFDVGTNGSLVLNEFNGNFWDKYDGYDINRDGKGDVPYRPVSMFSMIIEKNPPAMILFRSLITSLMDKTEKLIPSITPENLIDEIPLMKPLSL